MLKYPFRILQCSFIGFLLSCSGDQDVESIDLLWSSRAEIISDKQMIQKIVSSADQRMEDGPYSVLQKSFMPPSGDKHDYMSMGVYWWPNPDTENGLPYVRRDGFVNPEVHEITDKGYLGETTEIAFITGLAYHHSRDEKYAIKAAEVLRSWFINDSTGMNPNLNFGQGVPGRTDGRCYGIIETRDISKVLDAERLIRDSPAWTDDDHEALQGWFRDYRDWLLNSELGQEEFTRLNNHGTWYDVQVSSIALGVDDPETARRILARSAERIIEHVDSLGRQPQELARTRSWDYSVMNLKSLMLLGNLGEKVGMDLWEIPDEDDPAIKRALNFLIPYALAPETWNYEQVKEFNPKALIPLIEEAKRHYPDKSTDYIKILDKLGPAEEAFIGLYVLPIQ